MWLIITWDCINDVNVLVLIDWDLVGVQSLWFRILIVMSWGFYLADIDPIYGLLCGLVACGVGVPPCHSIETILFGLVK